MELFLSCRKEPIVFEYGSGASTIWFSKRCKKVISVEDDKDWASKMSEILKKRDINNVDYNFVPSQLDDNKISQYQSFFYKNVHFENYVKTMLKYSNNFDLIFIDGRARPAAIELAHSKVNDGGIIVLDNSDRPRYSQAIQYLLKNQWKVLKTSGPVSYGEGMGETTIFYEKRLL
jgi:predicted O-methyltransferase YrrM